LDFGETNVELLNLGVGVFRAGCSNNQNLNFDFFTNPGGDSFTIAFTTNGELTSANNVSAVFFGGPSDNTETAKFVFPDGQMVEVLFRTEVRDNGCRIHFAGHHLVVE
jgi:hypothetical protein